MVTPLPYKHKLKVQASHAIQILAIDYVLSAMHFCL